MSQLEEYQVAAWYSFWHNVFSVPYTAEIRQKVRQRSRELLKHLEEDKLTEQDRVLLGKAFLEAFPDFKKYERF